MSGFSLSSEALELLIGSAVHVDLELLDADPKTSVKAGSFVILRTRIVNKCSGTCGPLLVQLRTRVANSVDSVHDERQVAFAGALHRVVPPLLEGAKATVDFAICPLVAGMVRLEVAAKPKDGREAARSMVLRVS